MDTETIDQEYEKLEGEFADIVKTVQGLVEKMQAAEKAGDANATEWLADLKLVVQDISDEQTQAKVLLLAIHAFIRNIASAQADDQAGGQAAGDAKPPLFAPGHEPQEQPQQQQQSGYGRRGMMGGYMGGGFAQAMEMGAGMSIGASLVNSIFR